MPPESRNAADLALWEERRECVRALLQTPLIAHEPATAEPLRRIRRHLGWLRDWFHKYPGWHLQVENDFARLEKTPHCGEDGTRGMRDPRTGLPFSPRRYVYFCLALAALEKSERQCVLGDLARDVERFARADPVLEAAGLEIGFDRREGRQDLVTVIRALLQFGVLLRVHGNEESYVQQGEDVLYTLRRPVLARMLTVRRGPSTLADADFSERLARMREESAPESDEARRRALRTELYRRLLDSPVLYYTDLPEEEQAYLRSQRTFLLRNIRDATGLEPEVRAEGIAMVDPRRALTDYPMPEQGTEGHAALLLAEELCRHLRHPENRPETAIPLSRLEQFIHRCAQTHGHQWRRDAREPAGQRQLLRNVLHRMEALDLLRRQGEFITPLPAIARYRLQETDHA